MTSGCPSSRLTVLVAAGALSCSGGAPVLEITLQSRIRGPRLQGCHQS